MDRITFADKFFSFFLGLLLVALFMIMYEPPTIVIQ